MKWSGTLSRVEPSAKILIAEPFYKLYNKLAVGQLVPTRCSEYRITSYVVINY